MHCWLASAPQPCLNEITGRSGQIHPIDMRIDMKSKGLASVGVDPAASWLLIYRCQISLCQV